MNIYGSKGEDFSRRMKALTDSTEYKLAHQVADDRTRETLRIQIRRHQLLSS